MANCGIASTTSPSVPPHAVEDARRPADDEHEPEQPPELRAPVPDAPLRDDVGVHQLLAGAVEARARDQLVGADVDEAAEGDDEHEGAEQRPDERPVVGPVEPREGRRAREDGHEGRGPSEPTPLAREGGLLRYPAAAETGPLPIGHESSQSIAKPAYFQIKRSRSASTFSSMSVPWPVLAFRSRRRAHPRRARSRRAGLRRSRAGAQALPRPGGVRLRHARRAPGPHRRDARDRAAALRDPAPRPEEGPHRPVRRPGAVGGLVGVVVRDLARSGPAPLPPRRARPARHRASRASSAARTSSGCERSTPFKPQALAQLRQPHRAATRLLHDGRHRARHRRAAPGAGRRQDRAHGDLLRHARRVAVRARLPRPRRPAHPRLDRRARRARPFLLDTYRNLPRVLRRAVRRTAPAATRRATRWPTSARSCGA